MKKFIKYNFQKKKWQHLQKFINYNVRKFFSYQNFISDTQKITLVIFLVDNFQMRNINGQYRQKHRCTNVLSFPYLNYRKGWCQDLFLYENDKLYLGDMFLAIDYIKMESIDQKVNFHNHLQYLIVHSLLHMFGFDHVTDDDFLEMNDYEKQIINKINNN